jgi:hypothetical protein
MADELFKALNLGPGPAGPRPSSASVATVGPIMPDPGPVGPAPPPSKPPPAFRPAALPRYEGAILGHLANPARPPFPYGQDRQAMYQIGRAMVHPQRYDDGGMVRNYSGLAGVNALDDFLHTKDARAPLVDEMTRRGYFPAGHPTTPTYARDLYRAYPWRAPTVRTGAGDYSEFRESTRGIRLGVDRNGATPSPIATLRHEMDHALAWQHPEAGDFPARVVEEIPPSIGDLLWSAHDFRQRTGQGLETNIKFPTGVTHNADWMARQAAQHGMFTQPGRTTAQLMATPSGLAWSRRLTDPMTAALAGDN